MAFYYLWNVQLLNRFEINLQSGTTLHVEETLLLWRVNFKLNSIKAELKQTTTVANHRPATHTGVNSISASEPTLSPPARKKQSKQYLQYLTQNSRHLTLFRILDDKKKVTGTKHDFF